VTYEYVLIPRRPGLLTVPAIWFSYFDPKNETYRTISTSSYKVKVVGSEDMLSDRSVGLSKTEVSLLGQDIRFIMRENPGWHKSGQTVFSEFWFWLINGFSVLVIIGAITLRWWTEKMESNLTFARRRQAWSKWQNRLRTLQKMADNVVGEDFYAQLSQAVNGYIADRLGLPLAGLGPKEIEQELRQYAIDSELITKTVKLLEKLDEIRFLPGMIIADDPKELLSSSREIVSALSKVI
ncbi:MAG TPA: BatD family protein, partial [Candidatus Marinimicrobia bacterium]|nr:BatD family protein [Candidatus Neomarinimicrobiota bacterium]